MPFAGRRMVTLEQVYMPITMREIVSNLSIGVSLSWSSLKPYKRPRPGTLKLVKAYTAQYTCR
jgi:hypothetical protein